MICSGSSSQRGGLGFEPRSMCPNIDDLISIWNGHIFGPACSRDLCRLLECPYFSVTAPLGSRHQVGVPTFYCQATEIQCHPFQHASEGENQNSVFLSLTS